MMDWLRKAEFLSLAILCLWNISASQRIKSLTPKTGSLNGATRLTISGEGFAQEKFTLNPNDKDVGNSVQLVSDTLSIPCDVERDSTHSNQITCNTRPMPHGTYEVRVSVDGTPIPRSGICNGQYWNYQCSFYPRHYRSPTITSISPASGLPETLVTVRGRIFTDVYGSNTDRSSNGLDVRFLRAYMGGMPCELLRPNSDDLYGLTLDNERSQWGEMTCKMTGTYVGHHNLSYILDGHYGRSLTSKDLLRTSFLNKLAMFQTYAAVNRVSPSAGSLQGGTILTIDGRYFDETDRPAAVLVGGQDCKILSLSDDRITCMTPSHQMNNMTIFPGGRGLKMEVWNDSRPSNLDEALDYNETRPGYSVDWVDSLSYAWPSELENFVARLSGFIVPPETDYYQFFIKGDDRYALYFSETGLPQDKVKVAYQNYDTSNFFKTTAQRSARMHLKKGKPHFIEVLVQEYAGHGSVDVGILKDKSPLPAQLSAESINEIQTIRLNYDVYPEKQVVSFENWTTAEPVKEVQMVTVSSSCFDLGSCAFTFYSLKYNSHRTGPIAVSASAADVQKALNSLWSIKPDTVQVTKEDLSKGAEYTVVFNSRRGDYQSLQYEIAGEGVNIAVTEVTKGKASLETFTLEWGGTYSGPIDFNADETQVQSAIQAMLSVECPSEIVATENRDVKFFRDYEDGQPFVSGRNRGSRVSNTEVFCGQWSLMNPELIFLHTDAQASGQAYGPVPLQLYGTLCFAYKGYLKNEIGVQFSYESAAGTETESYRIPVTLKQGHEWNYICEDLLTPLQTKYPGSGYSLLDLNLYRAESSQDFYVDVVHLGRRPTTVDVNAVVQTRKPAALARLGIHVSRISVQKVPEADASRARYEITASPFDCGHAFPLLSVGFLQVSHSSEDTALFSEGGANVTVTRVRKASPPMSGTFDVEIYGKLIEGLAANISAADLQFALEGIPEVGQLQVIRYGACTGYSWRLQFLTSPGAQPLIQINSSSVMGVNPRVRVSVSKRGGMFKSKILGDFLRVPESRPQVQVLINGIPSKCSGDCGFEWSAARTPTVTGINPTLGSHTLGTVVTITGSDFSGENATVLIGDVECSVLQISDSSLTCQVGNASAGTYPVSVSFAGLGHAQYRGETGLNFTNQLGVVSISPSSGSIAGGTLLTVTGYGFSSHTVVLIGAQRCPIVSADWDLLQCRTPPGTAGSLAVTVEMGEMSVLASDPFMYDVKLTPVITTMSPLRTNVLGHADLTIQGTNFQSQTPASSVLIGERDCTIQQWSPSSITCRLPQLPPGLYNVHVQAGNWGYATTNNGMNATIKYVLEVTDIYPKWGSLYGGAMITITGSGFSSNISDNTVSIGGTLCVVTSASDHQLECTTQPEERTHTVTNLGSHPSYGEGYAWSPSSLTVSLGDMVQWHWQAPLFVPLGYRVFSVANPSNTTYDGVSFNSGDIKTESGFFSYRFTTLGDHYYSSGYVDDNKQKFLQGVVKVQPLEDRYDKLIITVGGIEAEYKPGAPHRNSRAVMECASPVPDCYQDLGSSLSDGFNVSFLDCFSPKVHRILPGSGTTHDIIHIEGMGFSNASCANEVTVGGSPCHVINSTVAQISCRLSLASGLEVGVRHPVSVQVKDIGTAINVAPNEIDRRFVVLPVIDSLSPNAGGTEGYTRLTIQGSGFSEDPQTAVTVAGMPCRVQLVNYTSITCETSPASARPGVVMVNVGGIAAACRSTCAFQYSPSLNPQVTGVSPGIVSGSSTTVTVSGSGFGSSLDDVEVFAGDVKLEATAVTDSSITLAVGAMPVGDYALKVVISSKGLASGSATLQSPAQASLTPSAGSTSGGTPLLITGNGFVPENTSVTVDGSPCRLERVMPDEVSCVTEAHPVGSVQVQISVLSVEYPPLKFTFSLSETPMITAVNPGAGSSGTVITISGSGFGTDLQHVSVKIGGTQCDVSSVTDTEIQCAAGERPGGTFPVMLRHAIKGYADSQVSFEYQWALTNVMPNQGGYGGGLVLRVHGSGFDPRSSQVLVCGKECPVQRNMSMSTLLYCEVPPNNGTDEQLVCPVEVLQANTSESLSSAFTYKSLLTPVIAEVSPRRGGTAGGTRLTITGSNFSSNNSAIMVTIAGSVCDVVSANDTHIVCITNSQPRSQETKVQVNIDDRGFANTDNADFFYIDVWSSKYTWGGLSPPEAGMFAVITKNQTILLDTSTPVLKMLLIQGGTLVFDEADIELQAENILIADGGVLQVGTEAEPFQHKAIITLHGHLRSQELPIYGTKTLAIREGTLDLHGIPVPVPWTHLAATASAGSTTVTLKLPVTWKVGDEIVIASTGNRHSQRENEVRRIASVSADGRTLTLMEPLTYTHLGVSVTLPDGTVFEGRAEVGLLTRNVVVRGSNNIEWNDRIKACPEGFNTGEFATQTCFQGRFGEELGSDQFGGCIMFHAARPSENLAIGRIEHVEVFHAGQAFRLGRYPIHWHLMGDVRFKSYVRGCAIHQTYNRAVTIHNTHNLLVERNVIYDIMGGAFFIEDGIETGNVLQYNLAVFVKQSTSLLNDDVTPAAYWVTNPNNTIQHNAAAGGTHFGFWYRMHTHPDGPSYTPYVCQKKVPLGKFYNNTVHSQGWFGLWIFQDYFPARTGGCRVRTPHPAVFRALTTWNCEKGAEWVNVGAVQFHDFVMVNNEKAGVEAKKIHSYFVFGFGEARGAVMKNCTIVGHLDELGLGSSYCSKRGIILPLYDGLSVLSTTFINFDRPTCTALGVTEIAGTCIDRCGGWSGRFAGTQYFNSPNKAGFRWEHEVVLIDMDGSLTGNADHKVVPQSHLLDPAHCTADAAWSVGFPGAICDHTVNFHRLAFNNPSPSSLRAKNVILTNSHGSSVVPFLKKRMTHTYGWMALLPSAEHYNWYFDLADHITNISYNARFYGFGQQDYVIINHNLTQTPDRFEIVDSRNGSDHPLDFSTNVNGDWFYNESTDTVSYMVSGKRSQRRRRSSVDRGVVDVNVVFRAYRCFFPGCVRPTPPPPATIPPVPSRRPADFASWSNESFWRSSPENNFKVPVEGSDVVVPIGVWLVMDSSVPSLEKLTVLGVLEIPDTMNPTSAPGARNARSTHQYSRAILNATYISIQGGRLIAGWPDDPFKGELHIILRGNHRTPDWPLLSGPNQGSKVLGVFGSLDLYGMPHNIYHTKLNSTASVGSTTLSLREAVDWQAGDDIVISTTSYDPWETETRRITAVSADGLTLTINQSLSHTHIGELHSIQGSARSYRLAADVGLLSRNIKIIGEDYPGLYRESFGARVLVGAFTFGASYRGSAQIRNVEFYHTGQEGYRDFYDPRYSVAFLNLGDISNDDSYIQGCAFHHGFSPAIGVFGTNGLSVDDNVIYFTVGEGIRVWGKNNKVRRNLVTMSLWPGSYQGRVETFNFEWNAAIEVNEGSNAVLQGNIVAGFERAGFRIDGEPCSGMGSPVEMWHQNEAHGGLYGVYLNRDGLPNCTLIQGFTIWRSFDFGIYFQVTMSVQVHNVTLVDNGMGILPMIYTPPSLSHQYSNKTVQVKDALIVGSSPQFDCSQTLSSSVTYMRLSNQHRSPRPPNGSRSGICWPTFLSNHNKGPTKPNAGVMSYNAISGLMTVIDTTFVGFKRFCSGQMDVMFMTNPLNEDLQHPIHVERLTQEDSIPEAKVLIHRPDVSKANPSDCVDMDCDAKKKSVLKDLDGSLLGSVGTVVPQSEFEWDGDSRRGLGDYRIPKVMLSYSNGSKIPANKIAPNKGIIRDSSCTYMTSWQSYNCFGLNYEMLVIESMDADTETRRLSPVAVLGDGYVDLLNGPQDHGWCNGYTCQERVSLFHSIIATNKSFDIYFSSTSPQKLRLMLLNADTSKAVRVGIFYNTNQRLDIYVEDTLVAPTNALWNSDHSDYTLQEPSYNGEYLPQMNSGAHGSNFFDDTNKMLRVLLRGSTPVEIRTSPLLVIAFQLPAMTVDEFYGENLVRNLALFLKIPSNMIRITKVISEGEARRRRRSTGLTVEVEISQPPQQNTTANSTNDAAINDLRNIADSVGQAAVSGNLSQSIGFNVSSVGVQPPPPPPSDPTWKEVASEEVSREEPAPSFVSTVARLQVMVQPESSGHPGLLIQQPSVVALDEEGNCVSVGVTSLTLTVKLKGSNSSSVWELQGNTTVAFKGCWANFTDLSINTAGENMVMVFTLNSVDVQSRAFTIKASTTTAATAAATTTSTPGCSEDNFWDCFPSIFDSAAPFKSSTLYIFTLIFSLSLVLLRF
ncbi:fibrocystin-L-like isoform X2 [Conger conger]|uniref:fibrocystin-L-like isoform X2 n=1 Tax=Conger conger TaxID=82655 RepID=UPI002A5AE5F0|nr:fibrocystin-L-like isoform X2 [Conger conger]